MKFLTSILTKHKRWAERRSLERLRRRTGIVVLKARTMLVELQTQRVEMALRFADTDLSADDRAFLKAQDETLLDAWTYTRITMSNSCKIDF